MSISQRTGKNLFIVAISIGFGLIPLIAPGFFKNFPAHLEPLLESGIILATIVSEILNVYFNGVQLSAEAAESGGSPRTQRKPEMTGIAILV